MVRVSELLWGWPPLHPPSADGSVDAAVRRIVDFSGLSPELPPRDSAGHGGSEAASALTIDLLQG
eukprot:SAG31_NODE_12179_length_961_cov_0.853828_2_plen_65_part_00